MNITNILKLASHLDSLPDENFDMSDWTREKRGCGTVACIAGWASHLFPEFVKGAENVDEHGNAFYMSAAMAALDLPYDQAHDLFFGPIRAKPKYAAVVLRRLVETGKVSWNW